MGTKAASSWAERKIWRAGPLARTLWLLAIVALFALVPMLADRWAYDHAHLARIYDQDWARLLRQMGWFPTWMLASLTLWLTQRKLDAALAKTHTQLLFFAPALAGIVCELLKLTIRREWPMIHDGDYGFRPWEDRPFSTAGLGMPSSHTMVAFAAATVLARIFPGARWVWYALAAGCAATRVIDRAHFVSDVSLGALLGWSIGWGVWIALRKKPTY